MASRQETENKRRLMREELLEACRSGSIEQGGLLPPVRDLARKYSLSTNLAGAVIQSLVKEGVLLARPGLGTIAGNPPPASSGAYLFLLPQGMTHEYAASSFLRTVQRGFELAIVQHGGSCLILESERAHRYLEDGQLPELAGIFSLDSATAVSFPASPRIPRAFFGDLHDLEPSHEIPTFDVIRFDDEDGGARAARHLLKAGFEKIAFLALHPEHEPEWVTWSANREKGWRAVMAQKHLAFEGLAFHPPHEAFASGGAGFHGEAQDAAARKAATLLSEFVRRGEVTAVIASNSYAARALFAVLQEAEIPHSLWPAVVSFDGFDGLDNHVVSALTLPWDDVGKAGARLLWERNVGRLKGAQSVRLVPLQLIPRLTSALDWKDSINLVMPQLAVSALPFV